jgi:hypothetical protein
VCAVCVCVCVCVCVFVGVCCLWTSGATMGSEQVAARKGPRISASSARSHTRNKPNNNPKRTLPSAFAGTYHHHYNPFTLLS